MKHHNHFSAFMAVGKLYTVDIKLHGLQSTALAVMQIEADTLIEFVGEFDRIIDQFIDAIKIHGYPEVCRRLENCNKLTEYHYVEVFSNLGEVVRELNIRE